MKRVVFAAVLLVSLIALTAAAAQQQDQSPQTVEVVGQVNMPGVYNLRSDLTLVQAITLANGLTARADKKAIIITTKDGEKTTADLSAILKGSVPDVQLKAGDVVRVPELSR
jgi:protein involved in polysaccharide export with SLBB domain